MAQYKDGTDAMDLGKNKKVTLQELVLEIAAIEKFAKKNNAGAPDPVIDKKNTFVDTKGNTQKVFIPSFMKK